ncbi:MAG: phytanoyl-CoA dioxygenase family protein [Ilumatobacteraceae bacterium]
MSTSSAIDRSTIDTFRNEGAAVLRGVVTEHELESLRSGIDDVVAHPSDRAKVASTDDDPGFFIEDFCTWRDRPAFGEFLRSTRLPAIAARLMGSERVVLYHDHVLVKEPRTRQRTPWHQDQPYYDVEGVQNVSFWIPVDPVPIGSSLELVAGTHVGPWLMPRSFLDRQARWFPEGSLADLPDIDARRHEFTIRSWSLEPGDAIAFHMLTVHGAPGVAGDGRRRVFSLRVLGDDMVYAPRDWVCSPDFGMIIPPGDDTRRVGESLDGEWFPELWPHNRLVDAT